MAMLFSLPSFEKDCHSVGQDQVQGHGYNEFLTVIQYTQLPFLVLDFQVFQFEMFKLNVWKNL